MSEFSGDEAITPTPRRVALGMAVFSVIAFGVPLAFWIVLLRKLTLDQLFDSVSTYWFTATPSLAGFAAAFAEGSLSEFKSFRRRVFTVRFPVDVRLLALLLPVVAALLTVASHPADLLHGGAPKWAALFATIRC